LPVHDLPLLLEAADRAAEIAHGFWRQSPRHWDKAGDAGPVSEADIAVDTFLRDSLTAARPGYGWLSEETPDTPDRLAATSVFVVDPIDGTRAYLAGEKAWAHSLSVVTGGKVTAGVVMLPEMGLTYAAAVGQGATLNGQPIHASACESLAGARFLANRHSLKPEQWRGGLPGIEHHFRPSLAWRIALVASGEFDATVTLRDAWEWDVAAGSLIAAEAGAVVTDGVGRPPVYNNPLPLLPGLIAAPPVLHDQLLDRRQAMP
jgi:myo-inositol-1(or 4)-monophosphatase